MSTNRLLLTAKRSCLSLRLARYPEVADLCSRVFKLVVSLAGFSHPELKNMFCLRQAMRQHEALTELGGILQIRAGNFFPIKHGLNLKPIMEHQGPYHERRTTKHERHLGARFSHHQIVTI